MMWNPCRTRLKQSAIAALLSLPAVAAHAAFSVVMTSGHDGAYVPSLYANARSVTAAKQLATANCAKYLAANRRNGKCSVFFSGVGPGYVAVVNAVAGGPAAMGAAVAPSRQEAINRAYTLCRNGDRYACKASPELLVWDGGQRGLAEPQFTSALEPSSRTVLR